jgi:heme exporter protein A
MSTEPPALRIEHLTVERGSHRIIDDLSFSAVAGEALLLLGPNGAGKTTLLRALAGFMPIVAGRVTLTSLEADCTLADAIHFIGHQNAIKLRLTVRENLAFWQRCLVGGNCDADTFGIDTAMETFGLADLADVEAGYLSAGQKRRAALARLLVAHRTVWLLDEPTVSLDAATTGAFARVVDAHLAAGGIAIAATHLPLGLGRSREIRLEPRTEAA